MGILTWYKVKYVLVYIVLQNKIIPNSVYWVHAYPVDGQTDGQTDGWKDSAIL